MKKLSLFIILIINISFAQTAKEKEDALVAEVPLQIWDIKNSEKSIKIDTLMYDEIPKSIDFKGVVVTTLTWEDKQGKNILIFSKSGDFGWKDYDKTDKSKYTLQDKSELFAYLFLKPKGSDDYKKLWRIYDFTECFGVDMYVGFKQEATTISDIDKDGITEVAIPYVLFCRGGMDPGIMKVILYESDTKYALRGETAICRESKTLFGGEYKADESLKNNKTFNDFLKQRWEANKCE